MHAARKFFEGDGLAAAGVRPAVNEGPGDGSQSEGHESATATRPSLSEAAPSRELLPLLLVERVAECHRQGMDIANTVLWDHSNGVAETRTNATTADATRSGGSSSSSPRQRSSSAFPGQRGNEDGKEGSLSFM